MKTSMILSVCLTMFCINNAKSQISKNSQLQLNQNFSSSFLKSEFQDPIINGIFQLVYRASTGYNNEPVEVTSGIKTYYVFNKKGVVLMAMGSSISRALYDISGGIKDGRIIVGSYTLSQYNLGIEWNSGKTVNWEYSSLLNEIYLSDQLKLNFVQDLNY